MTKTKQDDQIRKVSGLAYSRLVTKKRELEPLDALIGKFLADKRKWQKKAKAAAKAKRKQKQSEAMLELGMLEIQVAELRQYKVRAAVGIKCQKDPECYVAFLGQSPDAIVTALAMPGADKMTDKTKKALRIAAVERALIELTKLGPKARSVQPTLLDHCDATDRIIRVGILMALVSVSQRPCEPCVARLREVIESQRDQSTLDYLTADTRIVLNLFERSAR